MRRFKCGRGRWFLLGVVMRALRGLSLWSYPLDRTRSGFRLTPAPEKAAGGVRASRESTLVGARFSGAGLRRHLAAAPVVGARFTLARRVALGLLTVALATLALVAPADAYLYWSAYSPTGQGTPAIGRADLDGSNPNQTFITGADWGVSGPFGLAVDLAPEQGTSKYVYWTILSVDGTIGRAPLGGTGPNQTFITTAGNSPFDLAVGGGFIYWSLIPQTNPQVPGSIARASSLHGEAPNPNFISPLNTPGAIAIDDTYIYWTDAVVEQPTNVFATIGRARLDGTSSPDLTWLKDDTANEYWSGVAVDGQYVYWSNSDAGLIGRANLNGSGPPTAVTENYISGATRPSAVAVDAAHIYWANFPPPPQSGSIGSANLNGSNVQQKLIAVSGDLVVPPGGLAVDAGPFACAGEAATIAGTGRSDTLPGTNGEDVIAARGGDDTVSAGGGDDLVCGARGADVMRGGRGDDRLRGGTGNDVTHGGASDDRLVGGAGRDLLRGASGADRLVSRERRAAGQARVSDRVDCGPGSPDLAVADRRDHVKRCERVRLGRALTRDRRPQPCPAAEAWARITQSFTEPLAGAQGVAAADRLCAARSS
jgi:Ca2+-binding RTX toxin-like protein